jgi:predicted anti-sigma-YlaC factor YlaD
MRPNHPDRRLAGRLHPAFLPLLAALLLPLGGCGIKGAIQGAAINGMGDTFAEGGEQFSSDNDPELVRFAMPFALKTMEMLIVQAPEHRPLRLAASRGFTQYAFAFVETEAAALALTDPARADLLRASAIRLYLRGRDHGLELLELDHPGFGKKLRADPGAAIVHLRERDLDAIYWTASAWAAAITLGPDRPALLAELEPAVALLYRGLTLDEGYAGGAFHSAMITVECLAANGQGSVRRARRHFARAVDLAQGTRATPYLALAIGAALPAQDRTEFTSLLEQALEVDPDADPSCRLENVIQQHRARALLEHRDVLFAAAGEGEGDASASRGR